jgi:ribosomal protein L16 Arg81 hydroxylase
MSGTAISRSARILGAADAYADGEETFEAGDAFYTPPGHIPVKHQPGTEVVFFSPAEELAKTEAAMQKNMQAMQGT